MSVSASNVGVASEYIESQAAAGNKIDDSKNIEMLYREGKEYTYLVTAKGKENNHSITISPGFENVTSVEVVQARIPFTEYTIEPDRNTFVYKVGTGDVRTITFPTQIYDNFTLVDMFNALVKEGWSTGDGTTGHKTSSNIDLRSQHTLRMGEEESTGRFFFYTISTPNEGPTATFDETAFIVPANSSDPHPLDFTIYDTTTAFYPLGLAKKLNDGDITVGDSLTITIVDNGVLSKSIYHKSFKAPYRYDLVVGDVVILKCPELDSYLNRGHEGTDNIMPLGEFFLSSPGMNESTFQKDIPDRPIAPPMSLTSLTLNFKRENTGSNILDLIDYNFRGVQWYIKLSIKTLEIPSSSALTARSSVSTFTNQVMSVPRNISELTDGFRNTNYHGRRRTVMQGNGGRVSSMMIN